MLVLGRTEEAMALITPKWVSLRIASDDINRPKESDFDLPGSRERQRVVIRSLAGARGYRKVQRSKDVGITSGNPIFDPVRNDPRWVKLMADAGLAEAHARAQAWRKAHPPEKAAVKK